MSASADGFTAQLWEAAGPSLGGQLDHPVVRGLADGTLEQRKFARFLVQDCLFIAQYSRALSLAAARSPEPEVAARFAEMSTRLVGTELGLSEDLARELGATTEEIEDAVPDPVARAYTDFLLRTAALEDFPEVAAAFLPCFWGYSELGRALVERPPSPNPVYARWIAAYAGEGFAETAAWCRELVDELATGSTEATRRRMREAFVVSSELEHAFWNVADAEAGASFAVPRMECSRPPTT